MPRTGPAEAAPKPIRSAASPPMTCRTMRSDLTAYNRQFRQHREWMIRSYGVTFTFILTRVLQPIPAWNRHSEAGFAIEIIIITFLAVLVPEIAIDWRELIT